MEPTRQVLSKVEGLDFTILDSGCCGMAGSFGYEQGHYEVSQACGERALFPAVLGTATDHPGHRPPASDAATRSPTSATTAAACTRQSCWRWRGERVSANCTPIDSHRSWPAMLELCEDCLPW
jgi:hypothetical protein